VRRESPFTIPRAGGRALSKILLPFFRVESAWQIDTGGVGLGLSIASRAVSLHHGRIQAENALLGLRVWIELPLRETVPAPMSLPLA
jgi:two-component system sensor histidine kinase CpxA